MEDTKICGLCFEPIFDDNFNTTENLNTLDNLGLTLNEDAIICHKCADIFKISSNFKTNCINNYEHLKTFVQPGIDMKLVLEEIVTQIKSEIKYEEEKVCLLCFKYYEVNSLMEVNLEQDIIIKEMFEKCLPEIDTSIVRSPSICYICEELLVKFYNFISHYKDTEVLRNLKKDNESFTKPEPLNPSSENVCKYMDNNFVKIEENREDIQEPEFLREEPELIKTENNIPMDETFKNLPEEGMIESNLVPNESEVVSDVCGDVADKKFLCDLCSFRSKRRYDLKTHYFQVHKVLKENEGFKCEECSYITTTMSLLIDHRLMHGLETSQFRCADCPFISKRKSSLIQHSLLHRDPLKTDRFQCTECPYHAKKKFHLSSHMKRHEKLHEVNEEVTTFTCNSCSFTTKRESNLVTHYKLHKDTGEEFREKNIVTVTLSNGNLKRKIIEASGDILNRIFYCDKCTYHSSKKRDLNNHYLVHLDIAEVRQFKCSECSYVTKRQSNLNTHELVHKDRSERKTLSCKKCPFQAKSRSTLSSHFKKNHSDGGPRTYICYECNYTTTHRGTIVAHFKIHRQGKNTGQVRKGRTTQKPNNTQAVVSQTNQIS